MYFSQTGLSAPYVVTISTLLRVYDLVNPSKFGSIKLLYRLEDGFCDALSV